MREMLGTGWRDHGDVEEVHSAIDLDLDVRPDFSAMLALELLGVVYIFAAQGASEEIVDGALDDVMPSDASGLLLHAGQGVEARIEHGFIPAALPALGDLVRTQLHRIHEEA